MSALQATVRPGDIAVRERRSVAITPAISIAIVLLALAWALVPGFFTSQDPLVGVSADALQPPSAAHLFGTDPTGRDVLARVIYGAGNSLAGAAIAVLLGLVAGSLLGVLAGSVGGVVEALIMRVIDVLLAVPGLLIALSVVVLLGFGVTNAAIAVGITSIAMFARLSRSQVVTVRRSEYVEAAFGSGAGFWAVLRRHVLPNSLGAVLSLAALQFGSAILAIATLGFLGYGAPPPTPEWGLLIAESRDYVSSAWWLTTLPGAVLAIVVLAANRLASSFTEATS